MRAVFLMERDGWRRERGELSSRYHQNDALEKSARPARNSFHSTKLRLGGWTSSRSLGRGRGRGRGGGGERERRRSVLVAFGKKEGGLCVSLELSLPKHHLVRLLLARMYQNLTISSEARRRRLKHSFLHFHRVFPGYRKKQPF